MADFHPGPDDRFLMKFPYTRMRIKSGQIVRVVQVNTSGFVTIRLEDNRAEIEHIPLDDFTAANFEPLPR
jgi:hypothetical protein